METTVEYDNVLSLGVVSCQLDCILNRLSSASIQQLLLISLLKIAVTDLLAKNSLSSFLGKMVKSFCIKVSMGSW